MKTLVALCIGTLVASVNANYISNTTTAAPATTAAAIEDASTLTINLASQPAGPLGLFQSIYKEVFDVQDEDEDDSAADESFTPYEGTDLLKMLQKSKACDSFGKKCTKCIKNGGCSYCDTTSATDTSTHLWQICLVRFRDMHGCGGGKSFVQEGHNEQMEVQRPLEMVGAFLDPLLLHLFMSVAFFHLLCVCNQEALLSKRY